jgi:hypothetical protein
VGAKSLRLLGKSWTGLSTGGILDGLRAAANSVTYPLSESERRVSMAAWTDFDEYVAWFSVDQGRRGTGSPSSRNNAAVRFQIRGSYWPSHRC